MFSSARTSARSASCKVRSKIFATAGRVPTDRDDLDLHQAFFDARTPHGATATKLTLRAGRQEMAYGSQRLISVRESPNNRLAFDAVRVLTRSASGGRMRGLGSRSKLTRAFLTTSELRKPLSGAAIVTGPLPFIPGLNADFYYLGLSRENATFARGTADELRHSLGTRLFGKHGALDWNFEFVGQFGSFGNDDILAWTAASDTGWTFADAPAKPRVFLRADIASGDHGGSNLGTFNPLFPRGAYFNEASLIGPQNLMDLQPGVELRAHEIREAHGELRFRLARKSRRRRVWRRAESASAARREPRALRRHISDRRRSRGRSAVT